MIADRNKKTVSAYFEPQNENGLEFLLKLEAVFWFYTLYTNKDPSFTLGKVKPKI